MARLRTAKTRDVVCIYCGNHNEVAQRAMSIFCAHCHKRLILEDYIIKTFQGLKGYSTCGNVTVEKKGQVSAFVQAKNLDVKGSVKGNVEVLGKIDVASTGVLVGDVAAPALEVHEGATFKGFCRIGPRLMAEVVKGPAESRHVPNAEADGGGDSNAERCRGVAAANAGSSEEKKAEKTGSVKAISTRRRRTSD